MQINQLDLASLSAVCDRCGEEVFTLGGHECGSAVSGELAETIGFLLALRERSRRRRALIAERARARRRSGGAA